MKFRTEIKIEPLHTMIGYENRVLAVGSCFTEHISERLLRYKFRVTANPSGVVFNPMSIARQITFYKNHLQITADDLHHSGERWFSYMFHSDFSALTQADAVARINEALRRGAEAYDASDTLLLTLGTAWIYTLDGEVVANCHKQPASLFERKAMSVETIVAELSALFENIGSEKRIILTLSPVRHIGDGLSENSLSKATLRVAIDRLCKQYEQVEYFPAYEILMDDLRDYRFYASDLVHPSDQAIDYIWEHFRDAVLNKQARELIPRVERIVLSVNHRPRNPKAEEYQNLVKKTLTQMDELKDAVDFREERERFRRCLEII